MMSLFSSFDSFFSNFCLSSFTLFIYFIFNKFYKMNLFQTMYLEIKMLFSFFLSLKPKMYNKLTLLMTIGFMISLVLINFSSVFSFIFPYTSNFGPILILSVSMWVSFIFFMMFNNIKSFLLHTIPEGAPICLSLVLFVIELISNMIRPITLSVRLVANILAGHLLMILLSKLVLIKIFIFPLYFFLNIVELFVAVIQAYIFCVLLSIYFSDIN